MKKGIIGIYGGLGPAATDDLNRHLTHLVVAAKDQDHPRRIVIYAPETPDRTAFLLGKGKDPLPIMKGVIKDLTAMQVSCIGIPCNTAHAFIKQLKEQTSVPIVNMLEETVNAIRKRYPKVKKIGVLATTGTLSTKIYHVVLEKFSLIPVVPNQKYQEMVMEGIYGKDGVKAHSSWTKFANTRFIKASNYLQKQGAEVIVMGCTEIPLALSQLDLTTPLVNPTEELAKALLRRVLKK